MNKQQVQKEFTGLEVAVIGMSCRFPGAGDIEAFWSNLKQGVESIAFFTDKELEESGVAAGKPAGSNYVKAAPLMEDIDCFDAAFFGYTPEEAEILDPQVRIFMECIWEALEDSGCAPGFTNDMIGLYAGASGNFLWEGCSWLSGSRSEAEQYVHWYSSDKDFLSNSISYKLDLRGPSATLYTACSTSLMAIHLACRALLSGECKIALAGGITIDTNRRVGYSFQEGMIFSRDGHCRAFDARAEGAVFGSGAGVVVLKRLKYAKADRDHIYAVIKGSAVNNDGSRKVGFTAPSVEGQAEVIRIAQRIARVEPESITYVETHGTGTVLGDPVEIEGLKLAFNTDKRDFCGIGSVKTNFGHLDIAAGVAGFIKTVLALTHRMIPPSLHFESFNPKIDFENSPFYVNRQLQEWKNDRYPQSPLRAGVSSFGIGGTNVHVVLEEWPHSHSSNARRMVHGPERQVRSANGIEQKAWSQARGGVSPPDKAPEHHLIVLSAKTTSSLERMSENLAAHFKKNPGINLADAAYTLQVGREAFEYRKMLVCANVEEAIHNLESGNSVYIARANKKNPPVVFMFPGQGAQYVNMGRDLYKTEPVFREEMDRCFEILEPLTRDNIDLKEILYPHPDCRGGFPCPPHDAVGLPGQGDHRGSPLQSDQINQTEITQPLLFIFEYALAKLLMHWGITPYAMIGHSIGEYVAACLAGVFSLEDALKVVTLRGRLMQQTPPGAMLSVSLSEDALKPMLTGEVFLAAVNGPSYCVVSGKSENIEALTEQLKEKGHQCSPLHTSHAFHSSMMDPILEQFRDEINNITRNSPTIPYISNVSGNWLTVEEVTDPGYWSRHLRQPVRFYDGLTRLLERDVVVFAEVGPGRALSTFVRKHNHRASLHQVVNLVRHPKETLPDTRYLMQQIGQLWLYGVTPDWTGFYDLEQQRVSLPTYPFEKQRYTAEVNLAQIASGQLSEMSGINRTIKKNDPADWFYIPSWKRTLLSNEDKPGAKTSTKAAGNDTWIFFMDTCGIGQQLISQVAPGNPGVVIVKIGTAFEKIPDSKYGDIYTVNPGSADDYRALLSELGTLGKTPFRIVHLWNITGGVAPPTYYFSRNTQILEEKSWNENKVLQYSNTGGMASPTYYCSRNTQMPEGPEDIDGDKVHRDRGFYSLFYLAQAIGEQNFADKIRIDVVTDGLQEVTGEERLHPWKALVLGPIAIIPLEYSQVSCRCIDILALPGTQQEAKLVRQLAAELLGESTDTFIAYRHHHRLVRTFEPVQLPVVNSPAPRLKEKGVYWVTGGLGGIGLVLAEYLASSVRARLILTGRSDFPSPQQWDQWLSEHPEQDRTSRKIQRLKHIQSLGAEVMVFNTDVIDYPGMQEVVVRAKQRWGGINGVIHSAGIPGGGMIQRKKTAEAEAVMTAKVKGTLVLNRVLKDMELDFFVLCSSINSIVPQLGQVDYYAANAFLDAFAFYKTAVDGTFSVSINWDTWQQLGMAVEAAYQTLGFKQTNYPLLEYHIREEPGKEAYFSRFDFQKNWMLNEHHTADGKGLLPGSTFLEMAREACESYAKNFNKIIEIQDVQFLTPLMVGKNEERDVALILEKQGDGFTFQVSSRPPLPGSIESSSRVHAVGKIMLTSSQTSRTHNIKQIEALCRQKEFLLEPDKNGDQQPLELLVFGPRWNTVKRIKYGKNQALAYLQLDDAYIDDLRWYKLHPALLDAAVGFLWREVKPGRAYFPFSYKRLTIQNHLPARILSYCRWLEGKSPGNELLVFNITIMDEAGLELVDIEEFTLREVSQAVKEKIVQAGSGIGSVESEGGKAVAPGDFESGIFHLWERQRELLQHGLLPEEGIDAFNRILAVPGVLPQVVVSTINLDARMSRFEKPAAAPAELNRELKTQKSVLRSRPGLNTPFVAPGSKSEKILADIWQEFLGIETIGIQDDFFQLGGDSLKAMTVGGRIHEVVNVEIPLVEFFNRPTIKALAQYITGNSEKTMFHSIEPVEKKDYYPLSSAQQRLYILLLLDPENVAYNLTEAAVLEGDMDKEKLEAIFRQLIARHESLRTSFHMLDGEPVQRVHDHVEFNIDYCEGTGGLAPLSKELDIRGPQSGTDHLKNFVHSFDLSRAPLMRVGVIHTPPFGHPSQEGSFGERYILVMDIHHIVHDGTSQTIFFREFTALAAGNRLPTLKIRYKDYSQWQRSNAGSQSIKKQEEYWRHTLVGEIPALNLPCDFTRPVIQSYEGNTIPFTIDAKTTKGLKNLALMEEVTLFMLILSIYNVLLQDLTGQEDVVVGTPVAGRKHPDLQEIIGIFLNTLTLRNFPIGDKSFSLFLREVKTRTLEAFDNQDYPFEELVEHMPVARNLSRNPLFDAMFILHSELQLQQGRIPQPVRDLKIIPYPYEKKTSQFDLTLVAFDREDHLAFKVEYCTELFKPETIHRFINYFKAIVTAVVENPGQAIGEIEILPPEEKQQLLVEFNNTTTPYPAAKTIQQLFEEQAARTPDSTALVGQKLQITNTKPHAPLGVVNSDWSPASITYCELKAKSDQLAKLLIKKGVKPGVIVGLMVERSMEMIIALLGILKAGGAYLPIDPGYPEVRINYMLQDSKAQALVVDDSSCASWLSFAPKALLNLSEKHHLDFHPSTLPSFYPSQSSSLAYVIYTSGSTGKPKGVVIEQGSAVNFIKGMTDIIDFSTSKTILAVTTISFDIFFLETLLPVTCGLKVVIAGESRQKDPQLLADLIIGHQVSMLQFTPSRLQLLLNLSKELTCLHRVKELIVGGEAFPVHLFERVKAAFPGKIYNVYGPTETTIWSTVKDLSNAQPGQLNIGKPIANTQIYIVDRLIRPQPVGIVGELLIGGEGTARGYLNNPELTNDKFLMINNQKFLRGRLKNEGWKGRRVEGEKVRSSKKRLKASKPILQENSNALYDFRNFAAFSTESIHLKKPLRGPKGLIGPPYHGAPGRRRHPSARGPYKRIYKTGDLARWLFNGEIEFLGRLDHQVKVRGFRIELQEIEQQLSDHAQIKEAVVTARSVGDRLGNKELCAYIVPRSLVDRQELDVADMRELLSQRLPDYMIPSYFIQIEKIPLTPNGKIDRNALPEPDGQRPVQKTAYIEPNTDNEKIVARLWEEVLKLDRVGLEDNFFQSGGDSLKAMTIVGKIHKAVNVEIPLVEFFNRPTIKSLAQYVTVNTAEMAFYSIEPVEKKDYYPLSSAQQRLYILWQMEPDNTAYNLTEAAVLEGNINKETLEMIFRQIIGKHESLRTSFHMLDGRPVQRVHDQVEFNIEPDAHGPRSTADLLKNFTHPFDLTRAPLMQVGLIPTPPFGHPSQGGSFQERYILLVDVHHIVYDGTSLAIFFKEFTALAAGSQLLKLKIQYKDYSEWSRGEAGNQTIEKQEKYWLQTFEGEIPVLNLPYDFTRPVIQRYEGNTLGFTIDGDEVIALKKLVLNEKVTLFMLILSIYNVLLMKLTGQEDVVVGTPVAGRKHPDLQEIIGIFLNTLTLRNFPVGDKSFSLFLREVKNRTLEAFDNQDYPFEELVENMAVARDLSRNPLFDTMFILHSELQLQQGRIPEQPVRDVKIIPHPYEKKTSQFDLTLVAFEGEDHLDFKVEYCTKLFKLETIHRFISYFKAIVSAVVKNPDQAIGELEILPGSEKHRLLVEFNDTAVPYPVDKTIRQLFADQVERIPDCIALKGLINPKSEIRNPKQIQMTEIQNSKQDKLESIRENIFLTYRELNKESSRLARVLREKGVAPDIIVGIMVGRSIDMIIGILGILKSGGAYLPIDPDYPEERIRYMLTDSNVEVVVTTPKFQAKVKVEEGVIKFVDIYDILSFSTLTSTCQVSSANLAYVIYTSGSTGKPKGVAVQQRNAVNFIKGMTDIIDFSPGKVILALTTISFDIFFLETLLPITRGLKVVMAEESRQKDPQLLAELIIGHQVSMLQFTPSRLQLLLNLSGELTCLQGVTELIVGGEAFPVHLFEQVKAKFPGKIYNVYGPTETSIWSTIKDLSNSQPEQLNIGKPIANTQIYIVDRFIRPQPLGIVGELLIGGEGAARGYLNNPGLTAEKFYRTYRTYRFYRSHRSYRSYVLYRTGDLARWISNGEIEFLGRMDFQVKIRGFRIELKEVEEQLIAHEDIKEAVVTAIDSKNANQYLCAYIVPCSPGSVDLSVSLAVEQLREHMARKLPDYMIPSRFIPLKQIPLTANGKIDRKALPKPDAFQPDTGATYVAPETETEKIIADAWKQVLQLEQVGMNDNFFAMGGNSLTLINLNNQLKLSFNRDLPVVDMFKYLTIRDLAHYITNEKPAVDSPSTDDRHSQEAERLKQATNLYRNVGKKTGD